jgi:hypothetical protein
MKILKLAALAGLAGLAALAAACGSDEAAPPDGGGPQGCADCGTALLTITDAPGDFQSYVVDVTSLELVRPNGTVVETIPATTRIDFAELVDLAEVLAARQVPAGAYSAATLRVDYSDAEIVVEDAAGGSLAVEPVDAAGQPLGEVELTVQLDSRRRLAITRGQIAHLSFDLNLEASNVVDLDAATVTVNPFILATVVPPAERDLRVRGRLLDVDTAAGTYTVQVRPFHHQHSAGELEVETTTATTFEINGMVYTGAAGLAQLATLADGTMVIAFGTLDTSDHSFTARRVLAGDSAEEPQREFLSGNVLSRSGDTLLVGGVRLHWDRDAGDEHARRHGRYLGEPVTVLVGPGTAVTRAGQGSGALDAGAISVGQRILAVGDVSRGDDEELVMDATAGRVRLNYTRMAGQVLASAPGSLVLDLASIHGLRVSRFDFTGTGLTPEQDADPDHYEVATGTGLDTSSLAAGEWTRVFGMVSPFGAAPPDFNAVTLLDYSQMRSSVGVLWVPGGTTTPFSVLSPTALTLDISTTPPLLAAIRGGGPPIALSTLGAPLTLVPAAAGTDVAFAIAHRSSMEIENFSDFGEFVAALQDALDGQTAALKLFAYGSFDAPAVSFQARHLLVVLND